MIDLDNPLSLELKPKKQTLFKILVHQDEMAMACEAHQRQMKPKQTTKNSETPRTESTIKK